MLIAACATEEDEDKETPNEYKKTQNGHKWTQKQLHGQFIRQTTGKASEDQWEWLRKGCLKRTTEALIMATQEQVIKINDIKEKIDRTQENSKCRMCGKAEETVNHVLSECSKLAQKEYKRQHDWFGTKIHWELCRKYGIEMKEKWYEHTREVVMENDKCKILWDFRVQTDHEMSGRRPDVIVVEKDKNLLPDNRFSLHL